MNLWPSNKVRVSNSNIDLIKENRKVIRSLKHCIGVKPKEEIFSEEDFMFFVAELNYHFAKAYTAFLNRRSLPNYRVGSLFIKDSFNFLNQGADESLHFITGIEVDGKKVLNRIIELNLENQNPCFARAGSNSVRKALMHLSIHGFCLLGYFHIHPGKGPSATCPSGIDLNMDRLLFRGGYESLGAIFSRDGFVRFYSSKEFNVRIYGKGVEQVDKNIYRIIEVS